MSAGALAKGTRTDHAATRLCQPFRRNRHTHLGKIVNAKCTVVVDARLVAGTAGGVEQVVAGLARGLSVLSDGSEQYLFLTHRASQSWLVPHIAGPCRIVGSAQSAKVLAKALAARLSPTLRRSWWRSLERIVRLGQSPLARAHDRELESLGADLAHFPRQDAILTGIPSIYHPHDLLHLHYPAFFSRQELEERAATYAEHCRRASMIAVSSSWTRDDIAARLGLPESLVHVVPLAPSLELVPQQSAAELETTRTAHHLPEQYALYPAQFWPHKNHVALVEACALLRDRYHLRVPIVLAGRKTEHTAAVIARIRDLDLGSLVHLTGYVTASQLRCLYQLATCVAIPTLFESASFPMMDAFLTGIPVAASTATSLPGQAGGAAMLFDPTSTEEIAGALASLWTSADLRDELAAKGREVVRPFSWERTARHFRAHYRRILDLPMTQADRGLLQAAPPY
jgi:glycosyltransferase involved in cell wall biosynthesis